MLTRNKTLDAIGWAQLFGAPALLAALWVIFVDLRFPEIPLMIDVVVIAALVGLGFALVLIGWSRFGGYGSYRSMRRWVRGGPDPSGVPPTAMQGHRGSLQLRPRRDEGLGLPREAPRLPRAPGRAGSSLAVRA